MTKPTPYTYVPTFEWDDATVKSLKLRPRRCYCGPFALAVVNEMTCFEANEVYRKLHRSRRRIGYTGREEMEMAFRSNRFPKGVPFSKFITVGKCIRERGKYHWKDRPTLKSLGEHLKPRRLYIVLLSGHFVTVNSSTMQVCDAFRWG